MFFVLRWVLSLPPALADWGIPRCPGWGVRAGCRSQSRSWCFWWRSSWTRGRGPGSRSSCWHWSRGPDPRRRQASPGHHSRSLRCSGDWKALILTWDSVLRQRLLRWGYLGGRHWCRDQSLWMRTLREVRSNLAAVGCCSCCCRPCCWGRCCQRQIHIHNRCWSLAWNREIWESCCNSCLDCWSCQSSLSNTCPPSRPVPGRCSLCDSSAVAVVVSGWRAAWCSWRTLWGTSGWASCCWSWASCSRTLFEQMSPRCRPRVAGGAGSCDPGRGRSLSLGGRGRGSCWAGGGAGTGGQTAGTRTRGQRGTGGLARMLQTGAVKDWGHWGKKTGSLGWGSLRGHQGWRPQGWRCCPSRCRGSWRRPSRPSCSSPPQGRSTRRGQPGGSRWCRWWGCRSLWRRGLGRGRWGRWSWGICRRIPWRACLDTSGPGTCLAAHSRAPRQTGWHALTDKS